MQRTKKQSSHRPSHGLYRTIATLAALTVGVSLGTVNQVAIAQTPSSVAQASHSRLNPIEPRFCQRELESAISSIVESSRFSTADWGILIQPISESTVLYQHNADLSLIPASNVKLLTTAAALQIMGDRGSRALSFLSDWITVINQESDNDLADELLGSIGGQSAVRNSLARLGVDADSFAQEDGSGLSRNNRAKPSTFVTLLREMYAQDESGLFYQSLATAGINGTLENRFRNTPVQGRLHGKTGTLQGVKALSGYLENTGYGTIAFSIIVNQPDQSGQVLAQAIDQMVLKIAQVNRCD